MLKLVLILLIIFLIARVFIVYGSSEQSGKKNPEPEGKNSKTRKGVPKNIGEYIDYEEVKKQK
jgi:hypothetical protein